MKRSMHVHEIKMLSGILFGFLFSIFLLNITYTYWMEEDRSLWLDLANKILNSEIKYDYLFYKITVKRLFLIFIILILYRVFPGKIGIYLFFIYLGFSIGSFFTLLTIHFGFKGMIWGSFMCFPHMILYSMVLQKIAEYLMKRHNSYQTIEMRFEETIRKKKKHKISGIKWCLFYLFGILAESFLHPIIIKWATGMIF